MALFKNTSRIPSSAWVLGLAGLMPLWAAAIATMVGSSQYLLQQRQYAACILAFLGALHWGPVLNGSARIPTLLLAWGIVPSLWAWASLQLPSHVQALSLVAGLIAALAADLLFAPLHAWRQGYLSLRTVLTVLASVALVLPWAWARL